MKIIAVTVVSRLPLRRSLQANMSRLSEYEKQKSVIGDKDKGKMNKYALKRKKEKNTRDMVMSVE